MKLQLVTVSNRKPSESYYCYDECFQSARNHGWEIQNICLDGEYKGLISKPKILKRRFEDGTINCDLLLFIDCWDVLFLRDPAMAIDCWQHYGGEILFNAEKNLFPRTDLLDRYPDLGTPYRFLNSGVFIGAAGSVYNLLKEMNLDSIPDDHQKNGVWHHENDQAYFLEAFTTSQMDLSLDHNCILCQTLHGVDESEVEITRLDGELAIQNKLTNSFPVMAHANGGGKTGPIMPELLDRWRESNS